MEFISLPHLPAGGVRGGRKARSVEFLYGAGTARGFVVQMEAGGRMGPQRTQGGQLWVPLQGSCWVSGEDGVKWRLQPGHAAFIPKGEMHMKGTDKGVLGFVLQVDTLEQLVGHDPQ